MTAASKDIKNDLLLLAGPACVLLSVAVSTLLPTSNPAYFSWLALLGLAFSWKFSLQGLGLALLVTAGLTFFEPKLTFWDLGIYVSLIAAWSAIAMAVREKSDSEEEPLKQFVAAVAPAPPAIAVAEELPPPVSPPPPIPAPPPAVELELIASQQQELRAQHSLLERLRKELVAQCNLVNEVQQEMTGHRQDAQKYKGLHNQLREQFAAKSQQLDECRQRLFLVEEQLSKLQSELSEAECEGKSPWLKDLEQLLEYSESVYEEELAKLRRENALLEELVAFNLQTR